MGDHAARRRASTLAAATAAVAAVLTVVVVASREVPFVYSAPALHVMLETLTAVVAVLVAFLLYGRFREGRRLQDLLLTLALASVAVANLLLTALPDALADGWAADLDRWAPLTVRFVSTVVYATAALATGARRVPRRAGVATTGAVVALLLAIGLVGVVWGHLLPAAVDPLRAGDATRPMLVAHPVLLGTQAAGIVLFAVAAAAFARQSDRTGDALLRWVAASCVLSAFARVHYMLLPSLYSEYLYTGDVLRLAAYGCLAVGAAGEITTFWRARARAAVLEDRRRLARDLHDGLLQELAYISSQSRRLAARPDDLVTVGRIVGAAGRAVDESRRALSALTSVGDEPLPVALRRALDEMAARYDVEVVAVLDEDAGADERTTEAILRIAAEAVRNAVHHGAATRLDVRLAAAPLELTVADDGRGFAVGGPEARRSGGFGLTSMRERAEEVGAVLAVASAAGEGTTVRVVRA